ncbi:MAG: hypothetical protein JNK87_38025 [Bryobacterales bacterium]|nr:hypothetical protein [Bryobacterales bacterium]
MKLRLVLLLWAAVFVKGECVKAPETRKGRLEVLVFDATGTPIPPRYLTLELFPDRCSAGKAIGLPARGGEVLYGEHELRVSVPGFVLLRREVRIYQPEVQVRVELQVGYECGPSRVEIGGLIHGQPAGRELWVKATPLRGAGGAEVRVTRAGFFLIAGLDPSIYLLTVLDGEDVLHQEVVKTIYDNERARIEINLTRRR